MHFRRPVLLVETQESTEGIGEAVWKRQSKNMKVEAPQLKLSGSAVLSPFLSKLCQLCGYLEPSDAEAVTLAGGASVSACWRTLTPIRSKYYTLGQLIQAVIGYPINQSSETPMDLSSHE